MKHDVEYDEAKGPINLCFNGCIPYDSIQPLQWPLSSLRPESLPLTARSPLSASNYPITTGQAPPKVPTHPLGRRPLVRLRRPLAAHPHPSPRQLGRRLRAHPRPRLADPFRRYPRGLLAGPRAARGRPARRGHRMVRLPPLATRHKTDHTRTPLIPRPQQLRRRRRRHLLLRARHPRARAAATARRAAAAARAAGHQRRGVGARHGGRRAGCADSRYHVGVAAAVLPADAAVAGRRVERGAGGRVGGGGHGVGRAGQSGG